LKEKVGPKVQGCPDRSAQAALPTHSNTPLLLHHSFTYNEAGRFLREQNFFKSSQWSIPKE